MFISRYTQNSFYFYDKLIIRKIPNYKAFYRFDIMVFLFRFFSKKTFMWLYKTTSIDLETKKTVMMKGKMKDVMRCHDKLYVSS